MAAETVRKVEAETECVETDDSVGDNFVDKVEVVGKSITEERFGPREAYIP